MEHTFRPYQMFQHFACSLHASLRLPYILFHSQNQICNYKLLTKSTACVNYYYATVLNTGVIQLPRQVLRTSREFPKQITEQYHDFAQS